MNQLLENTPGEESESPRKEVKSAEDQEKKGFCTLIEQALQKMERERQEELKISQTSSYQKRRLRTRYDIKTTHFYSWSQSERKLIESRKNRRLSLESSDEDDEYSNFDEFKMTPKEMDQFYPKMSKPGAADHGKDSQTQTVLVKGLEKFDPFRQIFWRMRRAKETQRKLTNEILSHMKRRKASQGNKQVDDDGLSHLNPEIEFCDEIFRQINEQYGQQAKVQLYHGRSRVLAEGNIPEREGYSEVMSKDVDKGSFAFQKLFYNRWIVTGKEKRSKDMRCKECCCVGNEILQETLEQFPFLGIYDLFDLMSILGLKETRFEDENKIEKLLKSRASEDQKKEDLDTDSDSESVRSGEGYAALIGKLDSGMSNNKKIWVDFFIEEMLIQKFEVYLFESKEQRVPSMSTYDSNHLYGLLRKYLQIWEPSYSISKIAPLLQVENPVLEELPVPSMTLKIRENYSKKKPCFVLARHLKKQNWKVLLDQKPEQFANDWFDKGFPSCGDRELTIETPRGPIRTSKSFLERTLLCFQETYKSFLRLRFYLSRRLVRFFERHFDFINFLLLERNVLKELLVLETPIGFGLFWREYKRFCCYQKGCVQCINRFRKNPEDSSLSVSAFPEELVRVVRDEFKESFLCLSEELKMAEEKFICHSVQEHRRFFQFICKMMDLLLRNNVTKIL